MFFKFNFNISQGAVRQLWKILNCLCPDPAIALHHCCSSNSSKYSDFMTHLIISFSLFLIPKADSFLPIHKLEYVGWQQKKIISSVFPGSVPFNIFDCIWIPMLKRPLSTFKVLGEKYFLCKILKQSSPLSTRGNEINPENNPVKPLFWVSSWLCFQQHRSFLPYLPSYYFSPLFVVFYLLVFRLWLPCS